MKAEYSVPDRAILAACGFDADESDLQIASARGHGTSVLGMLIKASKITMLDYYLLCCQEHGLIDLDPEDQAPEFDLLLEMESGGGATIFAVGSRADVARRVAIMGSRPMYGSATHESFVSYLASKDYRVAGFISDNDKRLGQTLAGYRSRNTVSSLRDSERVELHDLFDKIASEAIASGASDMHITMVSGKTSVVFRINGDLLQQNTWALTQEEGLSLVRSMYNMVAEGTRSEYLPNKMKDGVIERLYDRGRVRFRFSSLPVEPGPDASDVTLRIIHVGAAAKIRTAQQLGYSQQHEEQLNRMFARSGGLIIFNGTTGSGKSTSMANYLMMYCKARPGKKVRTVEDPVEYIIPGAFQTNAQEGFNLVLKQIMRSDPDVIMVGEVRDHETADLCLHATRSGHLTISTLHANGCLISYDRLAGMGVSRMDLASVGLVAGMVYQKLVKVTCPRCRLPARDVMRSPSAADAAVAERLHHYLQETDGSDAALDGIYWQSPSGCAHCRFTGYSTRTVCAEIFMPRPAMAPIIAAGDSLELNRAWRSTIDKNNPRSTDGRTAFEHALFKMRDGTCSPAAVEDEFENLTEALLLKDL